MSDMLQLVVHGDKLKFVEHSGPNRIQECGQTITAPRDSLVRNRQRSSVIAGAWRPTDCDSPVGDALRELKTFVGPQLEVCRLIKSYSGICGRIAVSRSLHGGGNLAERRRREVRAGLWKTVDAVIPVAVQVRLFAGNHESHQVATAIALSSRICAADSCGAMQRLMNVTNKMDDEP